MQTLRRSARSKILTAGDGPQSLSTEWESNLVNGSSNECDQKWASVKTALNRRNLVYHCRRHAAANPNRCDGRSEPPGARSSGSMSFLPVKSNSTKSCLFIQKRLHPDATCTPCPSIPSCISDLVACGLRLAFGSRVGNHDEAADSVRRAGADTAGRVHASASGMSEVAAEDAREQHARRRRDGARRRRRRDRAGCVDGAAGRAGGCADERANVLRLQGGGGRHVPCLPGDGPRPARRPRRGARGAVQVLRREEGCHVHELQRDGHSAEISRQVRLHFGDMDRDLDAFSDWVLSLLCLCLHVAAADFRRKTSWTSGPSSPMYS